MKPLRVIPSVVLVLLVMSCDKSVTPPSDVPANIYDTTSVNFIQPQSNVLSPSENQEVRTASYICQWSGGTDVAFFDYSLDNGLITRTPGHEASLTNLDEGSHVFALRGVHVNGVTVEPWNERSFIVNAVTGPALMLRPRLQTHKVDDQFDCLVWADEMVALLGTKVTVQFDKDYLRVIADPGEGEFLRRNAGAQPELWTQFDNAAGKVIIEGTILGASPRGTSGSGTLYAIRFQALKVGSTSVDIKTSDVETSCRDTSNARIALRTTISCTVVIN